ncbi:hypothetical protein DUI87_12454 [Hirundo rustica rustica]|uniref:Uncharacterized protein n=1 Tax=Hirundo rustica rustica TaxID=333673 RepID=A0A3M0KC59_HIRRU|nr:hypothetical protein DUI87_12454 [Hirundo rustica rustica]
MLALLLSLHALSRSVAMASAERLAVPECAGRAGGGSSREHGGVSPGVGTEVREALERVLPALRRAIAHATQAATPEGLRAALSEVFRLVEEAWGMPALGRDVAKVLCDVIRLEGGLDLLLNLLYTAELETKCQAGKLLEQILVAENSWREEEEQPQLRGAGEDWGVPLSPLSQAELSHFGWLRASDPKDET